MKSFRILDASIPQEHADWVELWSSWPEHEVSAHPDYVRLFAGPYARSLCAILKSPQGSVIFPFILRPLHIEKWVESDTEAWDLVTPYGYGGAFSWGVPDADLFWSEFNKWVKAVGVVSAFLRFSLFSEQLLPFDGEVEIKSRNIVRMLDLDADALWMDYDHKVRKNVKKALRNGLEVEIDPDGSHLKEFLEVYYSTMDRRGATEQYYFPDVFFNTIVRDLLGEFVFFHVFYGSKIVSTELVLSSTNYLYSFLGGTLLEAYDLRPNDLLKHSVIEWGRDQGKKAFVLGGGYEDGDGIFRYKLSFAPNGTVPFKVGKRIYDPDTYERLIQRRLKWEIGQGLDWRPNLDFFPAYRS